MTNKIIPPENYDLIETEDGSYTFYSKLYDENCHSTSGASSETIKYFIENSKLAQCKDHDLIFEVGFGLGHGLNAVINFTNLEKRKLQFISSEIDPNLVKWYFDTFQNLFTSIEISEVQAKAKTEHLEIIVLIGDARETTPNFFSHHQHKIDRIFQDAFSPKKNPTLWELTWFEELFKFSNSGCILTTYSASHSVFKNLEESGFEIEKLKGFGRKRAATRAIKK